MRWLNWLLPNQPAEPRPSHEEVVTKAERVISGTDTATKTVQNLENKHIKDLRNLQKKARIASEAMKEIDVFIATALANRRINGQ